MWASCAQKCDTQWHSYVERAATIKTFSTDARGSDYANATGRVSPRHQVARRVIITLYFCPVVLQRRPSLSKIFTQSFRLSFVNMRSDSSSSPLPPPPQGCGACAKLFRDSLITSDGIYNYVGKFWRTFLD